jgi:O-antigen chain-terminating methyltransferase
MSGVDVTEIMRQVREQANQQRQKFALASAASPRRNPRTVEDLRFVQSTQDLSQLHFSSHRKMVGAVVVFAKKLLHQLLTPVLERQSAYNAVNTRLMGDLWERAERLQEEQAAVLEALRAEETAFLDALRATVVEQLEALAQQQAAAFRALQAELAAQHRERRTQEQPLTLLLEEARRRLSEPFTQEQLQTLTHEEQRVLDAFFATHDERFRGTRAVIKERLSVYLPILKEAKAGVEGPPILDLGCGRGEWLELLQEEGMHAKGVDRNPIMVEECRRYTLEVVESDLIAYLCSLPDGSVSAVTGFHLVEHLPFDVLLQLFDESVRVLGPGGVAIFETPNPQNVLVSTHDFYLDPMHRHPLPSLLMKFIAENRGLCRVKIMPSHPPPESYRVEEDGLAVAKRFNELFYGARDYAVIGWKA